MDRRKEKKKKKKGERGVFFPLSWTYPMENIEGIVVHGSPSLPHPIGDATISQRSRQGARGKAMVLDEHRPRFPSDPSSNSPSGARTGACRAP